MITIDEQLPVCQIGKGIDRKSVLTPYLIPALVPGKTRDKLPEQAEGSQHPCTQGRPYGESAQEIPT
jgi:hypothetical protein